MNQVIKQKWVAALRSGEYKQGKGALKGIENTFCCLGVLCDLHSKETGTPWQIVSSRKLYVYEQASAFLPNSVLSWSGIKESDQSKFVTMNDTGNSFSEIAGIIKRKF